MLTKTQLRVWYDAGRNMDAFPDQDFELGYGPLHIAYEMGEGGESFDEVLAELRPWLAKE
jgi:hypothetical protein